MEQIIRGHDGKEETGFMSGRNYPQNTFQVNRIYLLEEVLDTYPTTHIERKQRI